MAEVEVGPFPESCKHGRPPGTAVVLPLRAGDSTLRPFWLVRVTYCGKPECEESKTAEQEPTRVYDWLGKSIPFKIDKS
jgi:hypothetical protein